MPKFRVYGAVTGTKFLGVFEADTPEEAADMGLESEGNYVNLCHQCSDEFELNDSCCHAAEAELDD